MPSILPNFQLHSNLVSIISTYKLMPNDLKHKIENGKPCNCKSFVDEKINLKPLKNDQI